MSTAGVVAITVTVIVVLVVAIAGFVVDLILMREKELDKEE